MLTKVATLNDIPGVDLEDHIKAEPMVFSADPLFAIREGGSLTCAIIGEVTKHGALDKARLAADCVIDTRVHMLKPGWAPAIPGWHCDAIPRGADGQPDFADPAIPCIRHFLCVIDAGTGSTTEFLRDAPADFPEPYPGENTWAARSRHINKRLAEGVGEVVRAESGVVYEFDCTDYHRAIPATGSGWRYFFRASLFTKSRGPLNEIRQQVQVYMPDADMGW